MGSKISQEQKKVDDVVNKIFDTHVQKDVQDENNIKYRCSNDVFSGGFTPLMHAVMDAKNNFENFKNILATCSKDEIDKKNDIGLSALHLAVYNCSEQGTSNLECVRELLKAGADVNSVEQNGVSSLNIAISNSSKEKGESSLECVKLLLDFGADMNISYHGFITIHFAVLSIAMGSCDLECVKFLLEIGVDINTQNSAGITVLHIAAGVNDRNEANLQCLNFLLDNHADMDILDNNGVNTLFYVIGKNIEDEINDTSYVEILMERGAKNNFETKDKKVLNIMLRAENNILKRRITNIQRFNTIFTSAIKQNHPVISDVPVDVLSTIGGYF